MDICTDAIRGLGTSEKLRLVYATIRSLIQMC